MAIGPGNWFNLPEFGITELFGGKTGSLTDAELRSSGYPTSSQISDQVTSYKPSSSTDYTNLYKPVTTSGSSSGSYEQLIEDAKRAEEDRKRKEAEERKKLIKAERSAYNPFFEDLARQEAEIPSIQNDYMNTMNTGFNNQVASVERGRQAGLDQANASQGVIKQNQATSLRDLASNLSNAVNAFGQRLGQAGAGDSSAANMANYAYSKIANRNTADVMAQVRNQLAEVETAKQNLVRDAEDKLGALETWKADQTMVISQYVRSLQDYISQARAQGKQSMAENEVSAIREGFTRAMERMQQINDFEITTKAEILQNAQTALAEANAFSQNLQSMGNIQPEDIVNAPIDSGSISSGGSNLSLIPGTITEEKDKSLSDLLYGTTIPSNLG